MGHTPSTAGTLWKKFQKNSGKTPETLSELFLEFPLRVRLGSPKPYNSRHLKAPEHFQNSLPPSTAGDASFFQKWFRRGPLRAGHGIPSSTGGISDQSKEGKSAINTSNFEILPKRTPELLIYVRPSVASKCFKLGWSAVSKRHETVGNPNKNNSVWPPRPST